MTTPPENFPSADEPGKPTGFGESAPKGPIRYADMETFEKVHKKISEYYAPVLKKLAE